jgi:putative PIN family toxin of toxin-antitoxin system
VGKTVAPLRVVIDTNVIVSALLFARGRVSWLRMAVRSRGIVPLESRATVQELLRVLEYPKFALSRQDREELLADFLPYAEVCPEPARHLGDVECRDPHDQVFLDLAIGSGADLLVTGDADLLALAGQVGVAIVTPAELRKRVEAG